MEPAQIALISGGVLVGAAFGAVVQRTNFCIMGAVADFAISGDLRRMRAWMLAIAVAIGSSQALHLAGAVDLSSAVYRTTGLPLGGLLLGGLMFGFGMVIACGCTSRSLVNFASGDLRALVALVFMGLSGYMTMRGVLAYPRIWLTEATRVDVSGVAGGDVGAGALLSAATGLSSAAAEIAAAAAVMLALAAFAFGDRGFRAQRRYLFAAVSLGALIGAGWWVTGVAGVDEFDPQPLLSLRFVAPTGEALQYLMTFTGARADFGIATVGGCVAGALLAALTSRTFRLRAFEDLHDMGRYLTGGVLMGVGGVLCLGCTVGQGMSGVSTLALGSFIATAAIIAGGILGVRYLEQGSLLGAVRAAAGRA